MRLFSSWTGSEFLLVYAMLLAFACLGAWWIPARLRKSGRRGSVDDLESVAVLAGGRDRLTVALLAELFVSGALEPVGKGRLRVASPDLTVTSAGQALLGHDAPLTPDAAVTLLAGHAERVAVRLKRAGLLMRGGEVARLRWLSIAPLLVLLVIGVYRLRAGSAVGEPTGFLAMLLVLTAGLAVIRYAKADPRTAAGIAVLRELRARHGSLARAPGPDEAAMAVALYGTGVLIGTPWEAFHAIMRR